MVVNCRLKWKKSTKMLYMYAYLYGRWWFRYAFKHKGNNMCVSGVLLGENIMNTISGSCLFMFLFPNNQHHMVICQYMSGNEKSIYI